MTPITAAGSDLIARGQVDDKSGWFYYDASPTNATQRYLYRARLDGTGTPERLNVAAAFTASIAPIRVPRPTRRHLPISWTKGPLLF